MDLSRVRNQIVSTFKINGLSLRSDASTLLVEELQDYVDSERDFKRKLEQLIETVHKQPLTTSFVTREVVETSLNECREGGDDEGT